MGLSVADHLAVAGGVGNIGPVQRSLPVEDD
jgi:hypothetical protein